MPKTAIRFFYISIVSVYELYASCYFCIMGSVTHKLLVHFLWIVCETWSLLPREMLRWEDHWFMSLWIILCLGGLRKHKDNENWKMGTYNTYSSEHVYRLMKSQRFKQMGKKVTCTRNEKHTQKFGPKSWRERNQMEELGIVRKTILICILIKRGYVERYSAGPRFLSFLHNVRNDSAARPTAYYISIADSFPRSKEDCVWENPLNSTEFRGQVYVQRQIHIPSCGKKIKFTFVEQDPMSYSIHTCR
jgi:hypothetical protein